jgi:hypothetical protein
VREQIGFVLRRFARLHLSRRIGHLRETHRAGEQAEKKNRDGERLEKIVAMSEWHFGFSVAKFSNRIKPATDFSPREFEKRKFRLAIPPSSPA